MPAPPSSSVAFQLIDEGIRHVGVLYDDDVVGVVSARAVFAVLAEAART